MLWTYTLDNLVATLTAKNTDTGDQVTTYHYGSTLTESQVARNDLVLEISYPDSTGSSDRVKYGYNRQGERTKQTDQNGTVHEYEYDVLGMLTVDRVATLGTGIDGAVRRLVTTYDDRDLVVKVTSYDAASGGNVVNEVQYAHNGFNQVVTEYQEHGGAVNTGTSQKVEYAYEDGTSNTIRRTSLTYPNGRELTYVYDTGHDDELSRISWIEDDDMAQTHLAEYTYLGLGDIVKVDYTQPDVRYDLATGSGATTYAGLDRFDRIATDFWQKYSGTPTDFVKLGYAYDEVNNRLHREDFVAKAQTTPQHFDELYTYDGLNRLVDLQRGELSRITSTVRGRGRRPGRVGFSSK